MKELWNKYKEEHEKFISFLKASAPRIIPPKDFKSIEKAVEHVVEYGIHVPIPIIESIELQIQLRKIATRHYKKLRMDDDGHLNFLKLLLDTFWVFKRNNYELSNGSKCHKIVIELQSAGLLRHGDLKGEKEYLDDLIWMEKQLTDIGK